MKSRRLLAGLGMSATAAILLAGCQIAGGGGGGGADSLDDMEPTTLVVSTYMAENVASGVALKRVLDAITERTEGKLDFEVYWSGALFAATDSFQNIEAGTADIGVSSATYWPEELLYTNLLNKTVFQASTSHPLGYLQENAALNEIVTTNQVLLDEWERGNQLPLGAFGSPHSGLACQDEFDFDEARGKTARIGGPVWGNEIASFGMTGVSMAFSEVFDAMQRGVVDCATFPIPALFQLGLVPDLVKYFTPVRLSGDTGNTWSINLDSYNALPTEVQEIIVDEFSRIWVYNAEGTLAEISQAAEALTILDPAPYNEVMEPYHDEFLAGLVEESDDDAKSVIEDFTQLLDKWDGILQELGYEHVEGGPEEIRQAYIDGGDADLAAFVERFNQEIAG